MNEDGGTEGDLTREVPRLRQRVAELEAAQAERSALVDAARRMRRALTAIWRVN